MFLSIIMSIAMQAQIGGPVSDIDRAAELRKLEDLRDDSKFRLSEQRAAEYKSKVLYNAHYDFVQKFNKYLAKYLQGANPIREKKEALEALEKLKKTDGF